MSAFTSRLQFWTACLGNLFEHYDTALFGFLTPILAPLIFPEKDPITALIFTYAIIPFGTLARPIGSLVFGYIGDYYGIKHALFLTLAGMSFVSGCIAFSPTYYQVGLFAPLIFCFGIIMQNFLAAGETMGGAIFLLENTSEKHHDFLSGLYNASTMGGHLLASFGVFLIESYHIVDPGWRFLYLFGCITALFGCLIRRSFPSSQRSVKILPTFANLKNVLWIHRKALLSIMICAGFGCASYSMALVLINGLIPFISNVTKAEVMKINTYLLIFDFCLLPFFGWVASRIPRDYLMLSASLCVSLLAIPLFSLLEGASLTSIIFVRTILVIFGVAFFAPFHVWAGQLVPQDVRYTLLSLGYALGYQLFGSPTAAIALWCFQQTEIVSSVAWYWTFLGILSSGVVFFLRQTKQACL